MRILIVYYKPFFPVTSADKAVILSHIMELSKNSTVDLLAFGTVSQNTQNSIPGLHKYFYIQHSWFDRILGIASTFSFKKPLQCSYYAIPCVRRWLQQHIGEYDIIYPHFFRSFALVDGLHQKIIHHMHDAISQNYEHALTAHIPFSKKIIYRYEQKRLLRYELYSILQASKTFLVSKIDIDYFISQGASPDKLIHVPITVSPQLFSYSVPENSRQICFFGNMSYVANIDAIEWFVQLIFPHLPQDVTLLIVGASPHERVKRFASDRITITGFVDDPYELIAGSALVIAPMRIASGVQVKILEAMALGKTVVTTTRSALPIGGKNGYHYCVADSAEDFIEQISILLNDPQKRRFIGANAQVYCKENHSVCSLPFFYKNNE